MNASFQNPHIILLSGALFFGALGWFVWTVTQAFKWWRFRR